MGAKIGCARDNYATNCEVKKQKKLFSIILINVNCFKLFMEHKHLLPILIVKYVFKIIWAFAIPSTSLHYIHPQINYYTLAIYWNAVNFVFAHNFNLSLNRFALFNYSKSFSILLN